MPADFAHARPCKLFCEKSLTLPEKRYMLIFKIVEDTVYVDHVVDCRQDYGITNCSSFLFEDLNSFYHIDNIHI